MVLLLAASVFFANPSPQEMPKAQAFLVREAGVRRLEDRYDKSDLWFSRAIDGCWTDGAGREFLLATLDVAPPPLANESSVTRADYCATAVPLGRKDFNSLAVAIDKLSPVVPSAEFVRPHQPCRGLKEVRYYQGTNATAIVCAYLPEKSPHWSLATWTFAAEDDPAEMLKTFERQFLEDERASVEAKLVRPRHDGGERELLRADARHSVALYDNWRVTDGDEFTVLDDLGNARSFVVALTNDLKRMRAAYAATVPSPIDGSNVLCVARLFATRTEYLAALEANDHTEMAWTAAYWSPKRRELVAYLPEDGSAKLLETIRHEAFHQYLSYATSMIPASPWLNEGYAQYFEREGEWPKDTLEAWGTEHLTPQDLERLAATIPAVLMMDYDDFYSGSDEARLMKYRLARSMAYFLEKGAPKIRFEPFKDLKRDYMRALFETKDMREATLAAFGSRDAIDRFANEWLSFWKNQ